MHRFTEENQLEIAEQADKYLLRGAWGQAAKSLNPEDSWSSVPTLISKGHTGVADAQPS